MRYWHLKFVFEADTLIISTSCVSGPNSKLKRCDSEYLDILPVKRSEISPCQVMIGRDNQRNILYVKSRLRTVQK